MTDLHTLYADNPKLQRLADAVNNGTLDEVRAIADELGLLRKPNSDKATDVEISSEGVLKPPPRSELTSKLVTVETFQLRRYRMIFPCLSLDAYEREFDNYLRDTQRPGHQPDWRWLPQRLLDDDGKTVWFNRVDAPIFVGCTTKGFDARVPEKTKVELASARRNLMVQVWSVMTEALEYALLQGATFESIASRIPEYDVWTLRSIFTGNHTNITLQIISDISRALGCRPSFKFTERNLPPLAELRDSDPVEPNE